MRKMTLMLAPALALGLILGACSENTQDNVSESTERAGDSIVNVADDAGERIEAGAAKAGDAIEDVADDMGDAFARGANDTSAAIDNRTR